MMNHMNRISLRARVLLLSVGLPLVLSCASAPSTPTQPDPFFEKWRTMGETNLGTSPAPISKAKDLPGEGEGKPGAFSEGAKDLSAGRTLPKTIISITMRQADVQTILRALAKMADLNILVKEDAVKKESAKATVDFKKVPWDQVFTSILRSQSLQYTWEDNIIRIMNDTDMKTYADQRLMAMRSMASEPMETKIIPIHYRQLKSGTKSESDAKQTTGASTPAGADAAQPPAEAHDFLDILWGLMSRDGDGKTRGSISVDGYTNTLIVKATKSDLQKIMQMIAEIDKPTPQIHIKANIVETTKEMARVLGIQWGGMTSVGNKTWITSGGSGGKLSDTGGWTYTPYYGTSGISGQGYAVNVPANTTNLGGSASLGLLFGTLGGNMLDIQLSALQKDNKINILSSPSITTLDNQPAYTENGEKIPVTTIVTTGGAQTPSTRFEVATMRLEITPHVIDGKSLKMQIVVKKDEVDTSRKDNYGNPYIIKKETKTSLIVQNNETIVISGLTKQTQSESNTGVPTLKDVPVLGWLFKSDDRRNKMEEVLIFITPTILLPVQTVAAAKDVRQDLPENAERGQTPRVQ